MAKENVEHCDEFRYLPELPAYGITRDGRVKGPSGRWLKATPNKVSRYRQITTYQPTRKRAVHRLVALAWIGDPPTPKHDVAHLNGNRLDNRVENLAWKTRAENQLDSKRHGTEVHGEQHQAAKLTETQVIEIRKLFAAGTLARSLSRRFGVHPMTISDITRGVTWKHVPDGPITKTSSAKLAPEQVRQIRCRYAAGGTRQTDLAREFGLSQAAVSCIIRRTTWANLEDISEDAE